MLRQNLALLLRSRCINGRVGFSCPEEERKEIKERKLSLGEINHYIKVAEAIQLTIGLQGEVDEVYLRIG